MMNHEPIPFLDLVGSHRELEGELVQAFLESIRSAAFIGGAQVDAFEQEFAAYCGTKYCIGVGSGTDALRFALIASGICQGDAVVTVANTFIATTEAISQAGAEVEFVDIDEQTYNMSPRGLADYLEACRKDPRTGHPLGHRTGKPIKAIVPVHLYGQVADLGPIQELADRYGLIVIEDACQAHGAQYRSTSTNGEWRKAGAMGKAAGFSFYPGKNLGACGEAGAVTTDDADVAQKVRMLRDHGQVRKYYHDLEGYNGRLDAMQAAFLRIKLRRLDAWTAQRRDAAKCYDELLSALRVSGTSAGIIAPIEYEWSKAVYHLYVIRAKGRDALAEHLKRVGIATGLHYPVPVHLQNCYRDWGYRSGSLPATERAAAEILSLPMFPGLTATQQQRVVSEIEAFIAVGAER